MSKTEISWTEHTWNPIAGCRRVSPGCEHCYAETMAARIVRMGGYEWDGNSWVDDPWKSVTQASRINADKYRDLVRINKHGKAQWTGRFAFDAEKLHEPLRRRVPTTYFVNSMSDLFGEGLTNEQIAAVFGVMAACPQHTFQVLTKRPARMAEWFKWLARPGARAAPAERCRSHAMDVMAPRSDLLGWDARWPLPNVWLGVSVERQVEADDRIPLLPQCPAAVRWVSAEPLLGPVDIVRAWGNGWRREGGIANPIDWIVWGGESGHGARPCDIQWIRDGVRQCRAAGVPAFVKQLGAHVVTHRGQLGPDPRIRPSAVATSLLNAWQVLLKNKKGADPAEWPEDLRVREWPRGFTPPKSKMLPIVEAG